MSKLHLLIIGGAMGLLCASSPAALAQSAPQGGSKSSVDQSKAAFSIPKEGFFKYRGKSPLGDILVMDVTWKASQHQPKTESVRIGGDVKYKNPKTGMVDSLVLDENRSYINKAGELHFAVHAFGDKVFGPVDLAALERARLAKSDKPAEKKESGPGASGKGAAPSKMQSLDTSMDSGTRSTALNQPVAKKDEDNKAVKSTSEINQRCKFLGAIAYDDRFKASGSFNFGNDTFHWKQQKSTIFNDRRVLIKRARNCDSPPARDQIKSIIDDDGRVSAYFLDKKIFSKESFHTDKFKLLKAAIFEIQEEDKLLKKVGLKSLPGTVKNKKGDVVMTKGGLMLGGAIRSIGAYDVAHAHKKDSIHAKKTFEYVNQLLKKEKMGFMVHRVATYSGLKVDHHKTRGRSLIQGETAAEHEARAQQATIDALVRNAPNPPWMDDLTALVYEFGFDFRSMRGQ